MPTEHKTRQDALFVHTSLGVLRRKGEVGASERVFLGYFFAPKKVDATQERSPPKDGTFETPPEGRKNLFEEIPPEGRNSKR